MPTLFKIGASEIPNAFIIPRILPELKQRMPELEFRIAFDISRNIYRKVVEGSLDIGLVGTYHQSDYAKFEPIIKNDRLVVIAPPDHPLVTKLDVNIKDLKGQDFVGFTPGGGTRTAYEKVLSEVGMSVDDLNTIIEIGVTKEIIRLVGIGTGLAIVSELIAKSAVEAGRVVILDINITSVSRDFFLVTPTQRSLSPDAQRVLDIIHEITEMM